MRRALTILAALFLPLTVGLIGAPAAHAETGDVLMYHPSFGSGHQAIQNGKQNWLYVIDQTGTRFPVSTVTSQWAVRLGHTPELAWRPNDPTQYDCTRVHCAFIREENLGATGWRVRITSYDRPGFYVYGLVITINTNYAWDNRGTVSTTGACQAVGKGLGLDYTRAASPNDSCMSSAMTFTVPNQTDVNYVEGNWPPR